MDVPTAIGTIFPCLGVRGITAVMFSRDQLKRAASLTEEDFVQLGKCRRPHNRLGFAYQVAFVRLFDRFPQQQPFELFEPITFINLSRRTSNRHKTWPKELLLSAGHDSRKCSLKFCPKPNPGAAE